MAVKPKFNPFECKPCPPACESVFDRVVVSYLLRGGTRVMWALLPTFLDAGPLSFQLQVGTTNNNDADDWADVGGPVVDQYMAVDGEQRVFGKVNWAFYRVILTTSQGVYYSEPINTMGTLRWRDWRISKDLIRKKMIGLRYGGEEGFLLKRRVTGEKCSSCLDFQTDEIRNPDCPYCFGTGYQCGYYYPMACVYAFIDPESRRTELDAGQSRGTVSDVTTKAEMLAVHLMGEDDVWVNKITDDRYFIHRVTHTLETRGVPLYADVEMRPIAFTDIIYSIVIPEQFYALEF